MKGAFSIRCHFHNWLLWPFTIWPWNLKHKKVKQNKLDKIYFSLYQAKHTAKVLEGYFSGQGISPEKCGFSPPSRAPQPIAPELERKPENIQL